MYTHHVSLLTAMLPTDSQYIVRGGLHMVPVSFNDKGVTINREKVEDRIGAGYSGWTRYQIWSRESRSNRRATPNARCNKNNTVENEVIG